jgi:hypothetical protein
MSNNSQNINISQQNVQGKCDLKCSYNFNYSESNITAKNNGIMISLTYDNSNVPPVLYNNQKYTVSTILIVSPSMHVFNNVTVDAEIIVEHVPVSGGPLLFVAVPIVSSSESSTASNLLTQVIQTVSTNAPSDGNSTNLNLSNFTLQDIIPNKPFFSYTDNGNSNWIVFNKSNAITLSSGTLKTLKSLIKPFTANLLGGNLYYNSSGPNSTSVSEGIYISCQPTGTSEEETEVTYSKNTPSYDLGNMLGSPIVIIIILILVGSFGFIILFFCLNYVYNYFTSDAPKLPSLSFTG